MPVEGRGEARNRCGLKATGHSDSGREQRLAARLAGWSCASGGLFETFSVRFIFWVIVVVGIVIRVVFAVRFGGERGYELFERVFAVFF